MFILAVVVAVVIVAAVHAKDMENDEESDQQIYAANQTARRYGLHRTSEPPKLMREEQMRTIQLAGMTGSMFASVSDEDYDHLSQWRWYAHRAGKNKKVYAVRHITSQPKRYAKVSMHRELLKANLSAGMQVDHINGDGLDNQRANLRICTHAENARNRGISRNNQVGLKGVRKNGNGFGAHVMANRESHWLGTYPTREEAHAAYCAAASVLHGEFYRSGCPILSDGPQRDDL